MKLFPTIYFVDVMPTQSFEKHLKDRQVIAGSFGGRRGDYIIHVLNRKGKATTLLHELGHWLIEIILRKKSDKCHKFYDKYCRKMRIALWAVREEYALKEYSLQKWEQYQVDTRKERCFQN